MLRNSMLLALLLLLFAAVTPTPPQAAAGSAENIKIYRDNYAKYLKHDKALADAFLANYNGSEAQALVARAIWYMENGYMVYGHSKYWDTGYIDCSNFTSLVYKDFGYTVTSASKKYNAVGTKVPGVSSRKIAGTSKYELVGTENLRPGDLFTFWVKDAEGSGTHIGHVALYMGKINGKPAIIQTIKGRPTAIGILTNFQYWYGEHFVEARRVLDSASQTPGKAWSASAPVIPAVYQLPPQRQIVMPAARFLSSTGSVSSSGDGSDPGGIKGHWAQQNIEQMVKDKFISGYPDGSFWPDKSISRAEFVTLVVKAFEFPLRDGTAFGDTVKHWARSYITTADSLSLVSGYTSSAFGPDDRLSREQMTAIIVRAAALKRGEKITWGQAPSYSGVSIDSGSAKPALEYIDKLQISPWAGSSVAYAVEHKLISGYPDRTFRPQSPATRAEAITVIKKALGLGPLK